MYWASLAGARIGGVASSMLNVVRRKRSPQSDLPNHPIWRDRADEDKLHCIQSPHFLDSSPYLISRPTVERITNLGNT